ncbi:MAG: NDP-sugar synthase [Methanomassiliicoccales archaeon]|nr:NDP-sugar synthase [Methanomassiliicoccales archaeon]
MKALILAGGMGTRLRPLTFSIPKPIVPLLGKPLVMHIIDSLPAEVDTVVLAVSYMKETLEDHFRQHDYGRQVILVNEEEPLGTGGAIRNVRKHLDGEFLCFNGDIISSLDIDAFLRFHRRMGGIGTIALWQVPDPSAFGVIRMQGERIVDFQEKPAPGTAASDLINAGIYAFEPEILDHIGEGVISLERAVFPRVLEQGLFGYRFSGHWVDCGTSESYLTAQSVLIDHGHNLHRPASETGSEVRGQNHLDGVKLEGCVVGPHVCAQPRSAIMSGSTVDRSTLMEGAIVGKGCRVHNCILGPGTVIEDGAVVEDKVLIGH